jgi:hypothetical protein
MNAQSFFCKRSKEWKVVAYMAVRMIDLFAVYL